MKDFLDKFFDICRKYQQEIPTQKIVQILRAYIDRLDEWYVLAGFSSVSYKPNHRKLTKKI